MGRTAGVVLFILACCSLVWGQGAPLGVLKIKKSPNDDYYYVKDSMRVRIGDTTNPFSSLKAFPALLVRERATGTDSHYIAGTFWLDLDTLTDEDSAKIAHAIVGEIFHRVSDTLHKWIVLEELTANVNNGAAFIGDTGRYYGLVINSKFTSGVGDSVSDATVWQNNAFIGAYIDLFDVVSNDTDNVQIDTIYGIWVPSIDAGGRLHKFSARFDDDVWFRDRIRIEDGISLGEDSSYNALLDICGDNAGVIIDGDTTDAGDRTQASLLFQNNNSTKWSLVMDSAAANDFYIRRYGGFNSIRLNSNADILLFENSGETALVVHDGSNVVSMRQGTDSIFLIGGNKAGDAVVFKGPPGRWGWLMSNGDTVFFPRSVPNDGDGLRADLSNDSLYWSNWPSGGGGSGWTDDGDIVRLTDNTDSVGAGTVSPTGKMDVEGGLEADTFRIEGGSLVLWSDSTVASEGELGDSLSNYATSAIIGDTADILRAEWPIEIGDTVDVLRVEMGDTARDAAHDTADVLRAEINDTSDVLRAEMGDTARDAAHDTADIIRAEIGDTSDVVRAEIGDTVDTRWKLGDTLITYYHNDSVIVILADDDTTWVTTQNGVLAIGGKGSSEAVLVDGRLGWVTPDGTEDTIWFPRTKPSTDGYLMQWSSSGDSLYWDADNTGAGGGSGDTLVIRAASSDYTIVDNALRLYFQSGLTTTAGDSGGVVDTIKVYIDSSWVDGFIDTCDSRYSDSTSRTWVDGAVDTMNVRYSDSTGRSWVDGAVDTMNVRYADSALKARQDSAGDNIFTTYLHVDGSNPMSGDLDMDQNDIVDVFHITTEGIASDSIFVDTIHLPTAGKAAGDGAYLSDIWSDTLRIDSIVAKDGNKIMVGDTVTFQKTVELGDGFGLNGDTVKDMTSTTIGIEGGQIKVNTDGIGPTELDDGSDSPNDEDIVTYEATGTEFEYHSISDLGIATSSDLGDTAALLMRNTGDTVSGTYDFSDNDIVDCERIEGDTVRANYYALFDKLAVGDTDAVAFTFPQADGSSDQVLTTNGSGVLTWNDQSSGGGDGALAVDTGNFTVKVVDLDSVVLDEGPGIQFTVVSRPAADDDTLKIEATLGIVVDLNSEVTGTLPVGEGGTGSSSHILGGILYGSGSSPISNTGLMDEGHLLIGDGSGGPAKVAMSGDMLMGSDGIADIQDDAVQFSDIDWGIGGDKVDTSGWSSGTGPWSQYDSSHWYLYSDSAGDTIAVLAHPDGDSIGTYLRLLTGTGNVSIIFGDTSFDRWALTYDSGFGILLRDIGPAGESLMISNDGTVRVSGVIRGVYDAVNDSDAVSRGYADAQYINDGGNEVDANDIATNAVGADELNDFASLDVSTGRILISNGNDFISKAQSGDGTFSSLGEFQIGSHKIVGADVDSTTNLVLGTLWLGSDSTGDTNLALTRKDTARYADTALWTQSTQSVVHVDGQLSVSGPFSLYNRRTWIDTTWARIVMDDTPLHIGIPNYYGGPTNYIDDVNDSFQVIHPSVVYAPHKWNGYRYWMAATPYPDSRSECENLGIWVSQDGINWGPFVSSAGDTLYNPVSDCDSIPVSGADACSHLSDPELVFGLDNALYAIFRVTMYDSVEAWGDGGTTYRLYSIKSMDGLNWGTEVLILDGLYNQWNAAGPANQVQGCALMTPSVVPLEDSTYYIWTVEDTVSSNPSNISPKICWWNGPSLDSANAFSGGPSADSIQMGITGGENDSIIWLKTVQWDFPQSVVAPWNLEVVHCPWGPEQFVGIAPCGRNDGGPHDSVYLGICNGTDTFYQVHDGALLSISPQTYYVDITYRTAGIFVQKNGQWEMEIWMSGMQDTLGGDEIWGTGHGWIYFEDSTTSIDYADTATYLAPSGGLTDYLYVSAANDTTYLKESGSDVSVVAVDVINTGEGDIVSFTGNCLSLSAGVLGITANSIDGDEIAANVISMSADMATFTSANLAGRLTDEQGSGAAVFATSPTITTPVITNGYLQTSVRIPNGANLTTDVEGEVAWDTDDDALEVYNGSTSMLIPALRKFETTIWYPDSITDTVRVFVVDSAMMQGGIEIVHAEILSSEDGAYTLKLFEFTSADPPVRVGAGAIGGLTIAAEDQRADTASFTDATIACGNNVYVLTDQSADVDWISFSIRYYVKENN